MDVRPEVLMIALGAALVTVVPRVLPLVVLARLALPPGLRAWLAWVPIAVLAALTAAELGLQQGELALKWRELVAVLPVLAIAALTRSLIGAVIAGVAAMALLRV
jgi:branched-subunit amino acid transport protein